MKKFFTGILLLVVIAIFSTFVLAGTQEKISLNGTWQGIKGKGIVELSADGWSDLQIPGEYYSDGAGGAAYMWIKRQIDIPKSWQNKRVFVKFNMCSYNPHVYIDGKLIAERMEGWTPFEVEITSALSAGSTHWLQLRCQDRSATFADGFTLEPNQPPDAIRGRILVPVSGNNFFGPMDDVWLYSRPSIYLDDIVITPSTRKNTLRVSGVISDPTSANFTVEGKVLDKDATALEIPASPVNGTEWEISASFPNAEYWSPEDPHLYKLQLILRKNGEIIDTTEERFGFKEFWIEGPDFYLNGVKRHLLASGSWPIARIQSYDEARKALENIKAGNNVVYRYHTRPWQKRWVELADEIGVMIIDEAAVYTDSVGMYAYNDERFWENYRKHLEGLVKRDRNNASIIMWSVENELLFMGMAQYSQDLPEKLGDMGRFVKKLDPQHPITFEGDLDPDGTADVLGLHYPHELPTYYDWPNTADWLSERTLTEAGGGMLGMTRRNFYWDRTKPLYIGEYLWDPVEDYSSGTIFFGDEAYTDKDKYHNKAKLQAWIDQTIAYRRAGVSGICPWSCFANGVILNEVNMPFYKTQTKLFRPIAVFLRNKDIRFFSGGTVERTFDVFNDSTSNSNLSLKWKLADTQLTGEEKFSLEPGGYKPVTISFVAPDVEQSAEFEFQSELSADNKQIQTIKEKYTIAQRQPIKAPTGIKILLYDPKNTFHKNIPYAKRINSFKNLRRVRANSNLLIIAPQIIDNETTAAQIGEALPDLKDFLAFINKGGKVIVLEQNTLNGFGLGLSLVEKTSTMTFALNKEHPVLAGLSENDLKFWRSDNYVTSYEIPRPIDNGARAITVSGGRNGLAQSPILEMDIGRGSVLLIQALVGQKWDIEPAARKILQNSIDYMTSKRPNENNTIVFTNDENFTDSLSNLGLKYNKIKGELSSRELTKANILVLNGGGEEIIQSKYKIARFLNLYPPRTVYWHCPDAETFEKVKSIIDADNLKIAALQGPVAVNLREHRLLSGISREDLSFFTEPSRGWRNEIDIDTSIIDSAIMLQQAGSNQQKIEAETLELKGGNVHVDPTGKIVNFRTRGTASGWVNVPQSGIYRLSLIAGAIENRRIYPLITIKVGEKIVAQIKLSQEQIRKYTLLAELPAGRNELELSFTNGPYWVGGTQLMLDSLTIEERVNVPGNAELLTLPAALVKISAGKGQVIIDNIKWENRQNMTKGYRYASALFANLGASFEGTQKGDITWLNIGNFELVGESPYFEKTSNQINLRSNGTVTAEFNCAKDAEYTLLVSGYSTPAENQYAVVEAKIDDKPIGEQKEINTDTNSRFKIGIVRIPAGKHTVSVSFINDAVINGQDRNLSIEGVGFREN
jgi:hypothetical protein